MVIFPMQAPYSRPSGLMAEALSVAEIAFCGTKNNKYLSHEGRSFIGVGREFVCENYPESVRKVLSKR
jgi:hypothetical protein